MVRVAALKARLSEYIRAARSGHPVTIYDRDTPVARLVAFEAAPLALPSRKPVRALHEIALPPPLELAVPSSTALEAERESHR